MNTPRSVTEQKIDDIVTEGLNQVYNDLMKLGPDGEEEFIEYVANAAREYAKICVEHAYEANEQQGLQ